MSNNHRANYITTKIRNIWCRSWRIPYIIKWRRQNQNQDFSILCNNCVGAMVTHDLGIQLNSPTVNLFILPKDYLFFLENLKLVLSTKMVDATAQSPYPIGSVCGIYIHFLHYTTFEEAEKAWVRRAARLNMNQLFVVMIGRDGCTHDDLVRFDALPFAHKVVLTCREYKDIKSSAVLPGYDSEEELGFITEYDGYFGKRIYDRFNWVSFLNQKL